ncbi:MAG: 2-oxoacid:acceptor oxidoreductase family protein [Pseudomonadota bacterium]
MSRYEIRLAGSGGQGLILAGVILAEAAGLHDGKFVCQTQSYGPAARGGSSMAEVVISDAEIDYPKALHPDVLLAMNQQSLEAYVFDLQPGGLLLVDATLVREIPDHHRVFAIPFTEIAREQVGQVMTANLVALGALAALTGAVTLESLETAVLARVPPGTAELNKKALAAGAEAAAQLLRKEQQAGAANAGEDLG